MRSALKKALPLLLFVLLIAAADQITKLLVRENIAYGGALPVIPGVVQLTYVRNSGAAFSMFRGGRWFFLALVVVFFAMSAVLVWKRIVSKPVERWALAAICGGALGNAIDRAVAGEVTDMIEPLFMKFAVFNVADIFITCGAILLIVSMLFFDCVPAQDPERK